MLLIVLLVIVILMLSGFSLRRRGRRS